MPSDRSISTGEYVIHRQTVPFGAEDLSLQNNDNVKQIFDLGGGPALAGLRHCEEMINCCGLAKGDDTNHRSNIYFHWRSVGV